MTKIDIFSGFLGAGKTTLIKKLIKEAYNGEKLVLIENEFGEIGIDGGFMEDAGIEITEMNSGCICCSLVGDFGVALKEVLEKFSPDRILIEPSGVGKLSDVIKAVSALETDDAVLNSFTTIVDVKKCKMYLKNFGEFFGDQIKNAKTIVLSHTQSASEEKINECIALLREHNADAVIVTTPWDLLGGDKIAEAMEHKDTLEADLEKLKNEEICPECGHHHDHHHEHHDHECGCHEHHHAHHHDHECGCHEHHHEHHDHECECHEHHHEHQDHECGCHDHHHEHHDHECGCHEHHHEHHDHECGCHEHHHEHHDHECGCHEHHHEHHDHECGCHEHHHEHHDHECGCHEHHDHECGCHEHHHEHHHHHADEVFSSWGAETARKFTKDEISACLNALENSEKYGMILRAKGIVACECGAFLHFDYVPGEVDVRKGSASVTGRLCVIGSKINEEALKELFNI